ncbi:hypothetical protein [Salipiger sp.]|uniref:hypothetical protein n=1 Tax=Salipiger sp. TaxID=2078585 RepID=UPI003A96B07D
MFLLIFVIYTADDSLGQVVTEVFETRQQCEAAEDAIRIRTRNRADRIEADCVPI